jgi:hypothetical protein
MRNSGLSRRTFAIVSKRRRSTIIESGCGSIGMTRSSAATRMLTEMMFSAGGESIST